MLALALLLLPCGALADGEGKVTAARSFAVTAAYGGTVTAVSAQAGDWVSAQDVLATLTGEKVFASRDGVVAKVFAGAGEDASAASEAYGAALAVEPVNRFTVYVTAEEAYDSADTRWISAGETLYMKCTKDGTHRGVGIVTQVDGLTYAILCIGGEFSNGETVYVYRDSAYSASQKVGEGTAIATDVDEYAAEGTVVNSCVADGDAVEAGQLLMETVSGAPCGADWDGGQVRAGTDAIVLSVAVSEGDGIEQGQTVALLCAPGDLQVEFSLSEGELSEVAEGREVTVTFEDGTACAGTIEQISYVQNDAGGYTACVALKDPPEGLKIGQTANVQY